MPQAMRRRTALQILAGATAALGLPRRLWAATAPLVDEYFIFIHAAGGWDVTLWSDPRNERVGLIEPASTANTDVGPVKRWKPAPLGSGASSFEILTPPGSSLRLGPAIGDLYDLADRLTIINGIAMNTVSHPDGTVYSATGRHPTGGIIPQPSVDVVIASELGAAQLMPDVSIKFPSAFVGERLDQRAIPLRVAEVDGITRSFERSARYLDDFDRTAMSDVLVAESHDLGTASAYPETYASLADEHAALPKLTGGAFARAFDPAELRKAYPTLATPVGLRAALALEAIKRDVVRCVAFGIGGLDTHTDNYRHHAVTLQGLFGVIAAFVKLADVTPHPHRPGAKLSDHTHVLVISEFCRTPGINLLGGRDHYPNNSALVISPRFKRGHGFGETDEEQLLPKEFGRFVDGRRAIGPPDVLATFLGAFGVDPRRYMRDGEVVKELLA